MKLRNFEKLGKKIEAIIEQYDTIKRENSRIEALMIKKDKEYQGVKKQLEKALKERDIIRRRLDGLVEKIDSLDLM